MALDYINTTLTTFQKEDWKQVRHFILAQHRETSEIHMIFQSLRKEANSSSYKLSKKELYQREFNHISHKRFLNLLSEINYYIEDYLILRYYQQDKTKRLLLLNNIYNNLALYKKADRQANRLLALTKEKDSINDEFMYAEAQLAHQQYYSDNPIKYQEGLDSLTKLVHSQIKVFQIRSIIYRTELYNWGEIQNHDYAHEISMLKQWQIHTLESEVTNLLQHLINVVQELDTSSFTYLYDLLLQEKIAHPTELHTLVTLYLLQSDIKLWQRGVSKDVERSVKLIEYALQTGVYMRQGKIPLIRFHNIINTLGVFRPFEWMNDFILKWNVHLEEKYQASSLKLALAQNSFNNKKYERIIPLIRGVQFHDPVQKVLASMLELIALYIDRKNYYSTLKNTIANMKKMLKRSKKNLSKRSLKAHLNTVSIIEKLIQRDFRKVKIDLDKYPLIMHRKWVTEQLKK